MVKFSPLDLSLCPPQGFLIILFMGGGCTCYIYIKCSYSMFTHACQINAVPILSASLLSQDLCNSWISWGRLKMGYSFCLDLLTSELPFAIISKSKETASSSLSSSSSFPWLGCFPFPYFGTAISLSQSKVCQIWRKTTQLPGSAVDHCWLNWVRE